MNKICFLIPTFPPHYQFAQNLIDSYVKFKFQKQADLFFIFTNDSERQSFPYWEDCLCLPKSLRVFKNKGIINIKKFYGLMQLKNKYEYIIVLDDECDFIKEEDLSKICDTYFTRKILYGNLQYDKNNPISAKVLSHCKEIFPNCKNLNFNFYLWFNQLCIYKSDTLNDFFRITQIDRKLASLCYFDFDYYIYMFYLITYQKFSIQDIGIKSIYAVTEIQDCNFEILNENYKKICFNWSTKYMYPMLNNSELFLILHEDRVIEVQNHNFLRKLCKWLLQPFIGLFYLLKVLLKIIIVLPRFLFER